MMNWNNSYCQDSTINIPVKQARKIVKQLKVGDFYIQKDSINKIKIDSMNVIIDTQKSIINTQKSMISFYDKMDMNQKTIISEGETLIYNLNNQVNNLNTDKKKLKFVNVLLIISLALSFLTK